MFRTLAIISTSGDYFSVTPFLDCKLVTNLRTVKLSILLIFLVQTKTLHLGLSKTQKWSVNEEYEI
jgi:hypothetical protein